MKKINILFVSATSEIGGADLSLLDIIRKLNKELFNPIVVMPFKGPLIEDFKKAGAEVIIANTGYIRRYSNPFKLILNCFCILFSLGAMARLIRKRKVSFVHSNSSIVFGGALAAKILGVKHLWHVREIKTSPRFITGFIKRLIIFTSTRVIAISGAVRESFKGIPGAKEKVTVIYDGVDLDIFYPRGKSKILLHEFRIGPDSNLIGAIGLILPLKGYEYFLEAAGLLNKDFPDTIFMIVGDTVIDRHNNYRQFLKKRAVDLGIESKVIFTGMRQDIPDIISLMDICVLSSVEPEGLGRVLIEAMSMRKPVITTRLGGQEEAVDYGAAGALVNARDPVGMAQAITALLKDKAGAESLAEKGYKRAVDSFNLNSSVRNLEEVFLSLC